MCQHRNRANTWELRLTGAQILPDVEVNAQILRTPSERSAGCSPNLIYFAVPDRPALAV